MQTSERRGDGYLNLALLTDGLRAEREQGITIDVAYRYFQTARRKFIIADTPGHEQYTRNMVTGASTADLSIVLVDARKGVHRADPPPRLHRVAARHPARRRVRQQDGPRRLRRGGLRPDRRASSPTSPRACDIADIDVHPDLGAARRQRRRALARRCRGTAARRCSTTSSTSRSPPTATSPTSRFPVQWVIRPMSDEHHDYRGYAGQVAGGVLRAGDEVVVLPARPADAHRGDRHATTGELEEAFPPMSVTRPARGRRSTSRAAT